MSSYQTAIEVALLVFPLLAGVFTLPYIIYQYRKYGSISGLRSLIIYSFILYLTTIYFLIILPLPPISKVAELTTPTMQLIPFQFIVDFLKETSFVLGNPHTYLTALTEPCFYEVAYNFLLLVPFGIYLRYYFKCSWWKTLLLSFGLSLFFELTQLSGLYGIYPRPYRLFDVDDLMINSLGGMIGFWITPIITYFLPSKETLDEYAYQKGEKVSYFRRFFACGMDWFFIGIGYLIIGAVSRTLQLDNLIHLSSWPSLFVYFGTILLYFVVQPWLTKGQTLGKKLVKIKLTTETGEAPKGYQYLIRYILLYGATLPAPFLCIELLASISQFPFQIGALLGILALVLLLNFLAFIAQLTVFFIINNNILFYEVVSKTMNTSTIQRKVPIKEKEAPKPDPAA